MPALNGMNLNLTLRNGIDMYNSLVKDHEHEALIDLVRGVAWVLTMEKNLSREDFLDLSNKLNDASVILKYKAIAMKGKAA